MVGCHGQLVSREYTARALQQQCTTQQSAPLKRDAWSRHTSRKIQAKILRCLCGEGFQQRALLSMWRARRDYTSTTYMQQFLTNPFDEVRGWVVRHRSSVGAFLFVIGINDDVP